MKGLFFYSIFFMNCLEIFIGTLPNTSINMIIKEGYQHFSSISMFTTLDRKEKWELSFKRSYKTSICNENLVMNSKKLLYCSVDTKVSIFYYLFSFSIRFFFSIAWGFVLELLPSLLLLVVVLHFSWVSFVIKEWESFFF